ncbi:hypothetical protein F6X40_27580 [Paraburkholderia sp. UCT31]|uniref:hypothetical protein n=1 Tax=Paraburkholderia sp. UCT31 TaxID=2615209 RepID=UPI0016562ADD|nr:hypothetical protein [Paraburkholderia sp. UCT31]MBC8740422.1 hypothetical protein [Paraburkholderia sp. UCT31]
MVDKQKSQAALNGWRDAIAVTHQMAASAAPVQVSDEPKRYRLELNEQQLEDAKKAFELYARVGLGQLDMLVDLVRMDVVVRAGIPESNDERYERVEVLQAKVDDMKRLFTGHSPNASYGIHSEHVHGSVKRVWDLYKVVAHTRAWEHQPEGGDGVHFRAVTPTGDAPPASLSRTSEGSAAYVISMNDSVELVLTAAEGPSEEAEKAVHQKMAQMSEAYFEKNGQAFADRAEYESRCQWHVRTVGTATLSL